MASFVSSSLDMAGLSYISRLGFLLVSIASSSSFFLQHLQHLQQQQQCLQQKLEAEVMMLSHGAIECRGRGKKSQVRRNLGKKRRQRDCITLITITKIIKATKGTPTPTSTFQPAIDRPKTVRGKTKKTKIR